MEKCKEYLKNKFSNGPKAKKILAITAPLFVISVMSICVVANARKICEVVEAIPLDRLLVETDCPYMAPTPYRGKRNKSDYIEHIIEQISKIKEIDPKEVNMAVNSNFNNLIGYSK